KHGNFSKTLHVTSTAGTQVLTVTVVLPDEPPNSRDNNQRVAAVDRQAVFRGDCATCHTVPLAGRTGAELFVVACGICHFASHRAAMVPDLLSPREPRDAAYWQKWIGEGKPGTLMPGFAINQGGPLTDDQIVSLVAYALNHLPKEPRKD
ncbi:MAG: cytochrome c, partial [Opitutus sp.]|nr:cytochrome c [Opitutus sp.]